MIKFHKSDDSSYESSTSEIVVGQIGILNEWEHLENFKQLRSPRIMSLVKEFVELDTADDYGTLSYFCCIRNDDSGAIDSSSQELPEITAVASCFRKTPFKVACRSPENNSDDFDYSVEEHSAGKRLIGNNSSDIESDDNDYYDLESLLERNDIIHERYELGVPLGTGSYGWVVKCFDRQEQTQVAIKIFKLSSREAEEEIGMLEFLNNADYKDEYHLVRLKGHFLWQGRSCLVFELLSMNLFEYIEQNGSLTLEETKKFGHQICEALMFLSKPEINIVHCDLKPENILLCNSRVKIADFGSSQKIGREMSQCNQTRFYRAPEVILGLPYDSAIDMWSFGCILVELYTGIPLFAGHDEEDQMNKIVEVLGIPPQHLLDQGTSTEIFFHKMMPSERYALNPTGRECIMPETRSLYSIIPLDSKSDSDVHLYSAFMHLITHILVYDPKERISPQEALNHKFFEFLS
ncbi:hypothetical protein WA026_012286 [Henosepilachna vigintioctopunctata]|uniref:Protein kinase domain-containing protein n=1 Tax=Henosepilachna vigintioctopunctata TaxID=420089 RepID=A0AAW1UPQ6_9CUCU